MMTELERIRDNLHTVQARIARAALAAGRQPEDIRLVAATKMNSAARVQAAIAAGLTACGENRVQELLEKDEQHAYDGAELHFIGTLQTNKVKYLVGRVSMIQSVSSLRLAACIAKEAARRGIRQDILLEVNIGQEAAKHGFAPGETDAAVRALAPEPALRVRGLMAIPPVCPNPAESLRYFTEMQQLFVDISTKKYDNVNMDCLSMGMTADFEQAIACGANIVRVGSGIFGARPRAAAHPELRD